MCLYSGEYMNDCVLFSFLLIVFLICWSDSVLAGREFPELEMFPYLFLGTLPCPVAGIMAMMPKSRSCISDGI